jgi:hypothetical protein
MGYTALSLSPAQSRRRKPSVLTCISICIWVTMRSAYDPAIDYKSILNVKLGARCAIRYETKTILPSNFIIPEPQFQSTVYIDAIETSGDLAKSKKLAEKSAAYHALKAMELDRQSSENDSSLSTVTSWKKMLMDHFDKSKLPPPTYSMSAHIGGYSVAAISFQFSGEKITLESQPSPDQSTAEEDASRRAIELLAQYDSRLARTMETAISASGKSSIIVTESVHRVSVANPAPPPPSVSSTNWKGQLLELHQSSQGRISRPEYSYELTAGGKFIAKLKVSVEREVLTFESESYPNKKSCDQDASEKAFTCINSLKRSRINDPPSFVASKPAILGMDESQVMNSKPASDSGSSLTSISKNYKGELLMIEQRRGSGLTDVVFDTQTSFGGFQCCLSFQYRGQKLSVNSDELPSKKSAEQDACRKALGLMAGTTIISLANDLTPPAAATVASTNWKGQLLELHQSSQGKISRPEYSCEPTANGMFITTLKLSLEGEELSFESESHPNKKSCDQDASKQAYEFIRSNKKWKISDSSSASTASKLTMAAMQTAYSKATVAETEELPDQTAPATSSVSLDNYKDELLMMEQRRGSGLTDVVFDTQASFGGFQCRLSFQYRGQKLCVNSDELPSKKSAEQDASSKALETIGMLSAGEPPLLSDTLSSLIDNLAIA